MCILLWFLTWVSFVVGLFLGGQAGLFDLIYEYDITRLTYVIISLFGLGTLLVGHAQFHIYPPDRMGKIKGAKFICKLLPILGMIGTVIGFIHMLVTCFSGLDPTNHASVQAAMSDMALGMGTALITTAAGLICSFVLRVQLFTLFEEI